MNKKIMNEINVTPFIDVMLVLLVIFMITSPMMTPVIHVDLPKTKAASISGDDKSTIVTITNKGDIYLQDEITSPTNLKKRLLELSHDDVNMRIFVRGDKETSYGKIIKTISMIQEGGFTKVALITSHDNT